MTARTALWRVITEDAPPTEYTHKQDAVDAFNAATPWAETTLQQYNPMTGQWADEEKQ